MPFNGDRTGPAAFDAHGTSSSEALARPADEAVTLIPNSCIQFLIDVIDGDAAASITRRFFEDTSAAPDSDGAVLYTVKLEDDGSFHHPVSHQMADVRLTYAVDGAAALDAFAGNWLPVPFMRLLDGEDGETVLDEGPSNWARIFIAPSESGDTTHHSHRIVLAIDTTCCPKQRGRTRTSAAPSIEDAEHGCRFRFSGDEADIAWFVTEAWVDDWLRDVYASQAARGAGEDDPDAGAADPSALEYLGHYLTLLALLSETGVMRDIRLQALGRNASQSHAIAVDLVLDIGNSRTCAVLSETVKTAAGNDEMRCRLLGLRDFDQPWRQHAGLFSSRIEFSRASFGKESLSRWSGRTNAFYWPSLVRVGPEAHRLVCENHTTTDITGLSGPMRYLWDDQPSEQPWRFSRTLDNAPRRRALVSGPLLAHICENGDLMSDDNRAQSTTKPRFSRSSLLTFFGNEVMLQAIAAINAPAYRAAQHNSDAPRRLERILITVPAGMHPRERQIVLQRLKAAAELTWSGLGWKGTAGAPPLPSVSLVEDNATNAQTAYLNNEIDYKFRGKAAEYFDLMGKARPGHRPARAIRVACLDIGGGTTGLSVANYELQSKGIARSSLAVDGFNIGGDDILKRIIERHILPAIERALGDSKLGKPKRFLDDIIGGNANGRPAWISEFGRRFAAEFAMPVALSLLNDSRESRVSGDDIMVRRSFRQLLEGAEFLPKAVIEEFDELAADEGADGFALIDATIDMRHRDLKQSIGELLNPVLVNAVRIVEAMDCDLVLLSGWTTCLPPVLDALLGGLATQPNRIVPLQGMRVHDWYPHLDETGVKIQDAKSVAAVGALLASRRSVNSETGFNVIEAPAGPETRRLFVGRLGADGLVRNDHMVFVIDEAASQTGGKTTSEAQCIIKSDLPAVLGVRRLALERWPASPLFVIDVSDLNASDRPKMPVEVTLERVTGETGQTDELRIVKVRDGHGSSLPPSDLEIRLQTLTARNGHWSDTGAIVIA